MTEVTKRLNVVERAQMAAQVQRIAKTPAPRVDAHSGEKLVFVAHFDGTNNDKDNVHLSGNPYPTNVAELWAQMKVRENGNDNFRAEYYRGVGTDPGSKGLAGVLLPSDEMRATARKAYLDLEIEASNWLHAHPQADPGTSLQVMASGFSRGGGTAAIFSQMLYENGLTDPRSGQQLVAPGQLGLAGAMIYDPVATGYDGNAAFSPASKNITVVRAQHEYREWFKGVDHRGHPGVSTVEVMGNHCNIGGGYDQGISARVLEASTEWFRRGGVPVSDCSSKTGRCANSAYRRLWGRASRRIGARRRNWNWRRRRKSDNHINRASAILMLYSHRNPAMESERWLACSV